MFDANVYVIDDNEAVCHAMKLLFNSFCNLNIKTYHDPLLFLEVFSVNCRGCLIIDLDMPSMSGIDLMKALKKSNEEISIIIMSGCGTAETAAQSMAAGAYAFISKPFEIGYLLERVQSILTKQEA